ncbi:hypothetical protein H7F06_29140 [Burkholderia multivorans]|nr:hypothetical protein [Burkholderia multivorans]MBN7130448.1 hypothetical protein [Burkholderia multivorans]MBN8173364.1 hypothetical protein [Burkholderia multivorans]QSL29500.1 hypothetical protein G0D92_30305 [Burkholderia multivorans]
MVRTLPQPFVDALAVLDAGIDSRTESLLDVLASIVHPDMICSLFDVCALEAEAKRVALRCIDYALTSGLDAEQSAALFAVIEPKIAGRF